MDIKNVCMYVFLWGVCVCVCFCGVFVCVFVVCVRVRAHRQNGRVPSGRTVLQVAVVQ